VLVVNYEAVERLVLRELLSGLGMDVTESRDGAGAVAEIKEALQAGKIYDLVLLDSDLRDLEAHELVHIIKGYPGAERTALILINSGKGHEVRTTCEGMGIEGCLTKPVSRQDLNRVISLVLGRKERCGKPDTRKAEDSSPEDLRPLNLLLVEDTLNNQVLIKAFLKKSPCSVEVAENGLIAVQKFKSGHYDIVLMDMEMPVMDGYAATREIRKWETTEGLPRTPIVALTAYAFKEDREKSIAAGCDAHLVKPVQKGELLATIHEFARV
jgi:CheY-like chemotaxis protein